MSVRGNYMTPEEMLEAGQSLFANLHAYYDTMEPGPAKNRAGRLLRLFHAAGNALWEHVGDHGIVQPFDGTNKPPEGQ